MPGIDGAPMLRALAQEDTLRVFAAVVVATGTGAPQRSENTISIAWTTVGGVSRRTGLSDTAVVTALKELTEAHLTVASPEGHGWHTDSALGARRSLLCRADHDRRRSRRVSARPAPRAGPRSP